MLNDGRGKFSAAAAAVFPQLHPLGMLTDARAADLDGDGITDLVLAGNKFGDPPQFGKADGIPGLVLLGKGGRTFRALNQKESGLWIPGETKGLLALKWNGNFKLMVIRNNHTHLVFRKP